MEADATFQEEEYNEGNNNYTATVTSYYIADLRPINCNFAYTPPLYEGDTITVSSTLQNRGSKTAGQFNSTIKRNGAVQAETRKGPISNHSSTTWNSIPVTAVAGSNLMRIDVDVYGEVSEYSTSNNYCQQSLSAYAHDQNLRISVSASHHSTPTEAHTITSRTRL